MICFKTHQVRKKSGQDQTLAQGCILEWLSRRKQNEVITIKVRYQLLWVEGGAFWDGVSGSCLLIVPCVVDAKVFVL